MQNEMKYSASIVFQQILHLMGQKSMQLLKQYGLKPGQAGILFTLDEYENLSQKEIAKKIGVTPPSITLALKKMEAQGYIKRVSDENDMRIIRISNTDKGRECISGIKSVMISLEEIMYGGMLPEEILLFRRLLLQIQHNLLNSKEMAGIKKDMPPCEEF